MPPPPACPHRPQKPKGNNVSGALMIVLYPRDPRQLPPTPANPFRDRDDRALRKSDRPIHLLCFRGTPGATPSANRRRNSVCAGRRGMIRELQRVAIRVGRSVPTKPDRTVIFITTFPFHHFAFFASFPKTVTLENLPQNCRRDEAREKARRHPSPVPKPGDPAGVPPAPGRLHCR